jgi:HAD superfamily phosphoserine phosphatase-like hydrolase
VLEVFVDFDGTITDVDTFDALVRAVAGDAAWDAIDGPLAAGEITLREALARQAAELRLSRTETLAFMESHARVDPAFRAFVATVREHGASIRVVSSGIATIIHDALARAGVEVDVLANDVDFSPSGWTMRFVDPSDNGHDKAAHVRPRFAHGLRRRRRQRLRSGPRRRHPFRQSRPFARTLPHVPRRAVHALHLIQRSGTRTLSLVGRDGGEAGGEAVACDLLFEELDRFDELRIFVGIARPDPHPRGKERLDLRLDADGVDVVTARREVACGRDLDGRSVA